jgi:hypothetical protein
MVLALVAGFAGGALAQQYQNATFGFSLNLTGGQLAEYQSVISPEGITLTSPDGSAVINIFGAWNEGGRSLGAIVSGYKQGLPDATVTYEWSRGDAAVLSGYQAGDIFYVRIAMSPDRRRVAVLNMIYAPEVKRQLDTIVTRLSTSLSIR